MAFFPCNVGGGDLSETVLWTNPNPTSTFNFANGITLANNIDDYKYIKIVFRAATTISSEIQHIYEPADLKETSPQNRSKWRGAIQYRDSGGTLQERSYGFNGSSTNMVFYPANTGNYLIPLKVVGMR